MGHTPKRSATFWSESPRASRAGRKVGDVGYGGRVRDEGVDLIRYVAFQAADGLEFCLALGQLLGDVGFGTGISAHAHQGDSVDRVVRAAVSAAVEAVSVGLAAGSGDWTDSGECGERGFPGDPLRVVADGDQQLCCGDDPDAFRGEQSRVDVLDEGTELICGLVDLLAEVLMAPCQTA